MRSFGLCVLILSAACGGGNPGDDQGDDAPPPDANTGEPLQPPAMGFQLVSADIMLAPGEETTKCWYFTTPNTVDLAVTKWESQMAPGSHHMIVFFTGTQQQPHGTITEDCGFSGGGGGSVWTYSAQTPYADQQLPDGVGMGVPAAQAGFIQMHYLNATDGPLTAHVTLNVHTYPEGTIDYIPAAPFITFQASISIPPMDTASFGGSCTVPMDRDFYALGTHAHKQATHMEVRDGVNGPVVFETDSWSEPGGEEWLTMPFHRFSSGVLRYECDYNNPTDRTISTGDSAATDEMCMAVGYMFPAARPTLCVNDFIVTM